MKTYIITIYVTEDYGHSGPLGEVELHASDYHPAHIFAEAIFGNAGRIFSVKEKEVECV